MEEAFLIVDVGLGGVLLAQATLLSVVAVIIGQKRRYLLVPHAAVSSFLTALASTRILRGLLPWFDWQRLLLGTDIATALIGLFALALGVRALWIYVRG